MKHILSDDLTIEQLVIRNIFDNVKYFICI
jgi:hypothetical protein